MRRKQCEITNKDTIDAILNRCTIGRMATIGKDGYPYITPLNYVYLDNTIYFHCASAGEKLENINRDSRVCFEVDIPLAYLDLDYYGEVPEACLVHQFYHSVIIRGRAEKVTNLKEKLKALNGLVKSHESPGREFIPITSNTPAVKLCEVVAVRIETITGKSDLAQKKNLQEKKKLATYLLDRNLPGDTEVAHLILGDTNS
jgi:hypothetical protein